MPSAEDNLMRRPDGRIFLVDFGGVQEVYRNTLRRGGTFVGTLGYMRLELFSGSVNSVSDCTVWEHTVLAEKAIAAGVRGI